METKIKLPSSDTCCGCSACRAICPANAITMLSDGEGFLQPKIDCGKCIGCGNCERVCPVLHPGSPREPLAVYAAKAKDDELRRISSSGGIFSLLARKIIDDGGVVFGAAYETPTFKVVHKAVFDEDGLDQLRGSKYVQSEIGDTYAEAKKHLENGRRVLFSGCPCQIAGLRNFLNKDYANLLLVDVICHAVPSPKAWQAYLKEIKKKYDGELVNVFSRRNAKWGEYPLTLDVVDSVDSTRQKKVYDSQDYINGFVSELFNRKSCYDCSFRKFRSGSDITLGDYWGIEKIHPEFTDTVGISAVMVNSEGGKTAWNVVVDAAEVLPSNIVSVIAANKTVVGNHKPNPKRNDFFRRMTDDNLDELIAEFITTPTLCDDYDAAFRSFKYDPETCYDEFHLNENRNRSLEWLTESIRIGAGKVK